MRHADTEMIVETTLSCGYVTSQGARGAVHGVRFYGQKVMV